MRTRQRPRGRQRIDWDAEIEKTERIRRRGFVMSFLSFAVAAAVIVGVNRMGGVDIDLPRRVISVACIVLACLVLRATLRRRERLRRQREEAETAGRRTENEEDKA